MTESQVILPKAKFYAKLPNLPTFNANNKANVIKVYGQNLGKFLKDSFSTFMNKWSDYDKRETSSDKSQNVGIGLEWHLVKDKGNRLQYFRVNLDVDHNYSSRVKIPTQAGLLNLGVKFGAGSSFNVVEVMGTNTFTYISTRYNGIMNRPDEKERQVLWSNFKKQHQSEIKIMIKNIGKEGHHLN